MYKMASIRAKRFLRATSYSQDIQKYKDDYVSLMKSYLKQCEIINKAYPYSKERVQMHLEVIEKMYKTMMDYPEFLSRHPDLRAVYIDKIKEVKKVLKDSNIKPSIVLEDAKVFIEMVKHRSDYLVNKHSYNLRSRKF